MTDARWQRAVPAQAVASDTPPPMDAARRALGDMGQAVAHLAETLNISAATLQAHEAADRLEVSARLPLERLSRLMAAPLDTWFALFGDDLCLDCALAGLDSDVGPEALTVQLRARKAPSVALAAFARAFRRVAASGVVLEEGYIAVRLALGKARAVAVASAVLADLGDADTRGGGSAMPTVVVYYQSAAWERMLALAAVPFWEASELFSAERPTLVVLCDVAGLLEGVAFGVWGVHSPDDILPHAPSRAAWRRFAQRAAEVRALWRAESLIGGSAAEDHALLTPDHLRLRSRAPGLDVTVRLLSHLRAEVAALYLASMADVAGGELRLRFGRYGVTCALRQGGEHVDPGEDSQMRGDTTATAAIDDLAVLAEWAYGGEGETRGERLLVARDCLGHELATDRAGTLASVARAAGPALQAARANLRILRRGQTERYFHLRQAAQDAVAEYAEGVRAAASALAGEVVDNVYRTVGLLVAVMVAALLQPASSLLLVRVAAVLYTLYAAFVLGFYVRSRADRHDLDRADLAHRVSAMSELSPSERIALLTPAREAEGYFARYVARARRIYWVLIVAGALLAIVLFSPASRTLPLSAPTTRPTTTPSATSHTTRPHG